MIREAISALSYESDVAKSERRKSESKRGETPFFVIMPAIVTNAL